MDISTHSKSELKMLLKNLKVYRALEKHVGRRGRTIFTYSQSGEKVFRVEYFGDENRADLEPLVIRAYNLYFGESVNPTHLQWKKNDIICGGVRIFSGDDMVDVSFQNVKNLLKR